MVTVVRVVHAKLARQTVSQNLSLLFLTKLLHRIKLLLRMAPKSNINRTMKMKNNGKRKKIRFHILKNSLKGSPVL